MKIHSHSLIILLAIISIISLSGVVYYYFQTNQGMSTTSNQVVKNENTQSGVVQYGGLEDLGGVTQQETWKTYFFEGAALAHLGKYQEAIDAYNKSIELDPKNADVYYNKGIFLTYLGKDQEAIDALNKSIEIDLKNAIIYSKSNIIINNTKVE